MYLTLCQVRLCSITQRLYVERACDDVVDAVNLIL